jgi:hypothetical protein
MLGTRPRRGAGQLPAFAPPVASYTQNRHPSTLNPKPRDLNPGDFMKFKLLQLARTLKPAQLAPSWLAASKTDKRAFGRTPAIPSDPGRCRPVLEP